MDKDVRVRIKIDSETAKLDTLNNKVNTVKGSFVNTDKIVKDFKDKIDLGARLFVGYQVFNQTLADIYRVGIETNKTMQNLTNSLTTLRAVSASNVDSLGNHLTVQQKYNMAQVEAKEVLQELIKINKETPHSLNETTKIYDAMYLGMKKVGASSEDMIEITKKISIAAGNRMNFDALLSAMDGLSTGTVEVASDMGRFLKSIGLSNEEIKKSSNVVQLFKDKLSGFQTLDSFDTKISNLNNSFSTLAGTLTRPLFEGLEKQIKPATALLENLNTKLEDYYNNINKVQDIHKQNNVNVLKGELLELENSLESAKEASKRFYNEWTTNDEAEINKLELLIKTTRNKIKFLETPQPKLVDDKTIVRDDTAVIKIMGTEYQKLNLDIEDNIKKLKQAGATQAEIDKYRADSIKEFNEKQNKANKESIKSAEDLNKALLDIKQIGMSEYDKSLLSITEKTQEWQKAGVSNNEILFAQSKLLDELNQKTQAALVKEDLSYYERLIQLKSDSLEKDIELASISYTQKTLDIQDMNRPVEEKEKLISLESELYSKTLERLSLENQANKLDEVSNSYQDMLDSQISLIDATNDWNSNLTGTAASLADIASATGNLSKLNLVNLKAEDKLRTEYEKNKLKFYGQEEKQKELDLKYAKDKAALDDKNISATLIGYSNIAGAISGMFEQGSKEAATFQIAQSTLALVEGTRAILTAGTGDPYTAIPRMIAMAAMVSSLLSNIGVAFGMNSTSTYSDSFSSMEANTGTGTVFGDVSAQSESITNSLDILEDFAQPQYQTLLSMNNYLETIANNIGGVTSLLIQQGGFAFGDGYVGFDTGFKNNIGLNDITLGLMNPINSIISKIPILGQINGLFGSVVNSVLGGVFGKTKTYQDLTDSGIYFANQLLTNAINDFNGSAYQTITTTVTKKSWFKKSTSTYVNSYFQSLDDETERQFSLVLGNLYNTVLEAGNALDSTEAQTANKLKNFVVSIGKISLKGKTGDQIKETLESIFGSIGDSIAYTAFPALVPFQQIGEGMFETLTRVATGMEEAEFYISRLGNRFDDVIYTAIGNKQGDVGFEALLLSIENVEKATYPLNNNLLDIVENLDITAEELYTVYTSLDELRDRLIFLGVDAQGLSSTMIYGAGTITDLQSGFKAYFENFLSDDEQLAYKTEQLTEKFNDLGLALPSSNLAFKDLLLSIDETTASGQELFGRLIVLSEEFAQVSSLRVDALQEELDITNGTISNIKEISTSLDNVITSLRSGLDNSSTNMLEKFNKSMNATLLLSATDDYTALAKSVKDTINYSSALNNSDYFGSLKEMQYAQSVAANQFESININLDDELSVLQTIASNTNEMIKALSNLTTAVKQLQDSSETTASNTAESRYVS